MDPLCPFALSKKVGTGHHLFHVGVQMHHLAHNEEHRKQSPMQNEGGEDKWGEKLRTIQKTQVILRLSRFCIYKLHLDICRHVATVAAL